MKNRLRILKNKMANYAVMFGLGKTEEGKPSLPKSLMLLVRRADSLDAVVNSQQNLYEEGTKDFSHPIAFREVDSIVDYIIKMHQRYGGRYGSQPNPRENDLWFDGDNMASGRLLIEEQCFKSFT